MISLSCPRCGEALNVPDEYAGQKEKCKFCGTLMYQLSREPEPWYSFFLIPFYPIYLLSVIVYCLLVLICGISFDLIREGLRRFSREMEIRNHKITSIVVYVFMSTVRFVLYGLYFFAYMIFIGICVNIMLAVFVFCIYVLFYFFASPFLSFILE